MFRIDMLPAREGDCLWIEYGDPKQPSRILIDGGRKAAYTTLKKRITALPPMDRDFDLLVLSHIDADHIEGLLELIADPELDVRFKDVWFNGRRHLEKPELGSESFGAVQAEALTEGLVRRGWNWNAAFEQKSVVIPNDGPLPVRVLTGGMRMTLLSPTWEKLLKLAPAWEKELRKAGFAKKKAQADVDPPGLEGLGPLTITEVEAAAAAPFQADESAANGSSICLLAEYDGRRAVLAGDGHADVLASSLDKLHSDHNPLDLDAYKVSHHGSRGTHSVELMKRIRCQRFLISTDGSKHKHPHDESIARILKYGGSGLELRFNYAQECTSRWDNAGIKSYYKYSTVYPSAYENGLIRTEL